MNFPIDKKLILTKLDILLELLEGIELEGIEDDNTLNSNHDELFSGQIITVLSLKNMIEHDTYKQDGYSVIQIMKDANRIWKMGKLWKAKGPDFANTIQAMNDDIEEFISTGHKINAIKTYRQQMEDIYGVKVGLREAKDYIDNIQADMKRRGIV